MSSFVELDFRQLISIVLLLSSFSTIVLVQRLFMKHQCSGVASPEILGGQNV